MLFDFLFVNLGTGATGPDVCRLRSNLASGCKLVKLRKPLSECAKDEL